MCLWWDLCGIRLDNWFIWVIFSTLDARLASLLETAKHVSSITIAFMPLQLNYIVCLTPSPFHIWAFDFIAPINPPSRDHIWIILQLHVRSGSRQQLHVRSGSRQMSLKRVSGATVINFIQNNIIYQFGIPKPLLPNNGTPFFTIDMRKLLDEYGIFMSNPVHIIPKEMIRHQ